MIAKVLLVAFIATTVALVAADPIPVPAPIPANQVRKPVGTCPAKDPATPVYLPDDTNCDIFYECSGGVANEKQCQQGLCFDSKLNVCAWPEVKNVIAPFDAVGTCPPRDTNETVYLRDSANCSIYYVCSNGKPIQNVCPPDMSWNDESHICDWDLDANCQNEKLIIPYNAVGDCPPRDTNETIFLPDSVNCSLYYVCSNGRPIQNVCPPDMSWNNVNHICDWDLDANCNPSGNGKYMIAPLAAVGTCPPRDGNETVFLSDSNNCTIYYICSNGRPIAAACTPGMAWNSKLNICDWEIDVDCTSSKKKIGGKSVVGTCPEHDGSTPTYLPDSEDCQLYYECSNGIPVQNNCPGDQEFNPTLHVCDNPLDAGCKANGGTSAPTEVPTETTTVTTEEITTTVSSSLLNILPRSAVGSCPDKDPAVPVFLADDTDCQVYYECSNGVAIKNVCPGELQFNPVLDVCDDPLNAGCKATGTKSPLA